MRKFFSLIAAVLFAGSMMADNFVPVTDASTLADGDQIIITDVDALAAISTTQNNNNRGVAEVTLADGIIVPGENVQIITLVAANANFMLQVGEDAYLYAASNSSNHLKTSTATTVGDNGKFAISITEGVASVTAQGTNARNDLRYNPSSSCFSCYASTSSVEAGLKIFKKDNSVTPPAVATPVISGEEEFTESVIVTITCSTPEADIYYTTDGTTDPKCDCPAAPEYTQQIVLTETTTIMAAAYTGNDWSAVATKTFTKKEPLQPITCAEVYELAKDAELALNNVAVTYANGRYVYVQDATGSMLLYLNGNTTWEAGNILSGVQGTLDIYNGLYEVKMTEAQVTAVQPGQGEAPAPVEFTAAPVAADMNMYILLKNVTVSAETFPSNKNMNATIGVETFVLRNQFNADIAFDTNKAYDITGVVAVYNSTVQVYFINATEATVEHTYTVAGSPAAVFGEEWNSALEANDMQPIVGGEYTHAWGVESIELAAGNVEFKVCEDHAWTTAYPAQNYQLNISEAGIYNVAIFFNAETKAVYAEAQKVGDAPIVGGETIYDWAENIGTTILGAAGVEISTVKIHNNQDEFPAIKFGSSYVYADGKWVAIKPAEGGFKAGDTLKVAGAYSNDATDGSKYAQIDVYAADGETRLFRSDPVVNGKKSADDPVVENYVLAADADSLFLGRYGNTGMFITLLKVVRGAGEVVPPTPEHTYTVVGGSAPLFGNTWDPAYEANNMEPITGSEYLYAWKKEGVALTAGTIEYKVCQDHGWATAWPAQGNYNFTIDEAGLYDVTIFFNPELETPTQVVAEFKGAVVVLPNIILHGNFTGSWADTEAFTPAADSLTASLTLALAEGTYEFGFKFDGAWTANGANLTREANTTNLAEGSGNMHIAADLAGDYVFTYTYETHILEVVYPNAPVVPDTITIDIESKVVYEDYVADAGWWQFIAENDEYEISISNISTTQAAGIYTVADLDADYSYVFRKADSLSIAFVEGSFELTEGEDGSRTIEGAVLGNDGNVYNIKLVFTIPTPQTTVNVEIPNWSIYNGAEYYGFASYVFAGEAADGTYVQIVIPGTNPVGQFTYDDCYAGGTGIEVAGDYQSIYSMNITINVSDAGRAIITADILCFDYTLYHVTTIVGEGVDALNAAEKAVKMIKNGQVVIEKNGVRYNMNGAVIR